jgi:hypothetical protein
VAEDTMAKSGKDQSSPISSIQRFYRKFLAPLPLPRIITFLVVGAMILLLGGGVYDIIENPPTLFPGQTSWLFYYPSLHDQTITGSLIVMIVYTIGFAGLLLTYQSTKYAYRPRQAYILLLTGLPIILITYFYCETVINLKLGIG